MKKHPIIANGELYVEPITKKFNGGPKDIPHEYRIAKQRMLRDIDKVSREISEGAEIFMCEKIVCLRMEPKFEAKSYVPYSLLVSRENMDIVGGRKYTFTNDIGEEQKAKLYFMRTNDKGIRLLRNTIEGGLKDNIESWRDQLGSIHSLDLLSSEEKYMGFPDDWDSGLVEIVLHPINTERDAMISLFSRVIGISEERMAIKSYEQSLVFISAKCNRDEIERIRKFNPLRALHPLGRITLQPIRGGAGFECPSLTPAKRKSKIVIGVFDGGADDSIPLLKGYTNSYDCVECPSDPECSEHGNAVCGAVLHGNLAGISSNILPAPCVSVDSFRVLPLNNTDDWEAEDGLYEAIDAIEDVVKNRSDIKLYNISFGPKGAIVDDSISRFTYVMDKLTYEVAEGEANPLFSVAVGNDGLLCDPCNRIQSPADMVNGLGIGAYAYMSDGQRVRAPYSCIGGGREGAKVKPDLLEFGGSIERPFVLVGTQPNELALSAGTSFASPLAIGKIGRLMARCKNILPHLGRALLIHNAGVDENVSQDEQGYGFSVDNVDDILTCEDKRVTILYSGTLEPSHTAKLPIFAPGICNVKGKVNIKWTIATIVDPCVNDPDAYTNNCIEDFFVPHELIFSFTKITKDGRRKTSKLNLSNPDDAIKAKVLLSEGYRRSDLPVSKPAKKNWNETDLRINDLKWDTVIRKEISMLGSSLLNPHLTLHAMGRNEWENKELKYFAAITIDAPKYNGSLYDAILQNYQNLVPIEIRNVERVMVELN